MDKTLAKRESQRAPAPADGGADSAFGWRTVLFNDDWHTFQDVAHQLVKATRCTYGRGMALANVVHHTGSAIVYQGPKERCEAAAAILEDIKLKTEVCR